MSDHRTVEDQVKWVIENYGQNDQRTNAWHQKRGQMLTASEIYKTVKDATVSQRHELITGKLTPKEPVPQIVTARSLLWGTRYEPIAKGIFESMFGVKIIDTTCIPHPDHSFLGASPDGIQITDDISHERYGRLVEFKCPISRDFDENSPIPSMYVHQMQLQMECAGLNTCDYMEMRFREMNFTEWSENDTKYKSVFMVSEDGVDVKYRSFDDTRSVVEWKDEVTKGDERHWMFVFWILQKYRYQTVPKDTSWLETHLPYFQANLSEVQSHRESGTLPEKPKDKTVLSL
jgi:putative phage-type endonuclease